MNEDKENRDVNEEIEEAAKKLVLELLPQKSKER